MNCNDVKALEQMIDDYGIDEVISIAINIQEEPSKPIVED